MSTENDILRPSFFVTGVVHVEIIFELRLVTLNDYRFGCPRYDRSRLCKISFRIILFLFVFVDLDLGPNKEQRNRSNIPGTVKTNN